MRKPILSEKIKRAPGFLTIEPYLREQDMPVASDPLAREPRLVPLVIIDYGSLPARVKQMRYVGRLLLETVVQMAESARSIRANPYTGKKTIGRAALAELEDYARSLGVAEIGYAEVNPRYIFRGFRILFKNAVVFTIEMDQEKIRQAPSVPAFIEIFRTYLEIGVAVNKVAAFLRARGYNAHAGPAIGGDVNYIPLAVDAGLGVAGKHGLLITEKAGPRVRLAAVYTDIENLPLARDNPHTWIAAFCARCNACVRACPAGAIFPEPRLLADGGPSFIDHTLCAKPFSNDNGCTLCIKHCPFSYEDYGRLHRSFEGTAARRLSGVPPVTPN